MNDNPISPALQTYKDVTINPAVNSAALGTMAFGAGTVAWDRLIETAKSLLRRPVSMMSDMTPEEFDWEMDDIKKDKKLRWLIPGALGLATAGGSLAASYRPNEEHGGLLDWNGKAKPLNQNVWRGYIMPGSQNVKKASLDKLANDMFEYGGYVPELDFSQIVNVPYTKQQFFTNDPFLQNQPYVQNFGKSIVMDAMMRNGAVNVPMGMIYDSAVDKFKLKFSSGGIMSTVANTMLSNAAARLFTTALGAVTGLSKENQDRLVEAGTWAGAISSVIS